MSAEQPTTTERLRAKGAVIEQDIIALRRHFHRHPELSGKEQWTSDVLCSQLDELGIPYQRVAGTGVIATIRGTASGGRRSRVALRADIDALPVTEKTGVPYASEYPGVMHACGHDCHMAMMVGAARLLNDLRDELHGEVRVLFQPAEEISIGSTMMMNAGALDGVHSRLRYRCGTNRYEPCVDPARTRSAPRRSRSRYAHRR